MSEKLWGGEPFWGLGYEWDPDWVLTERQKELRAKLIDLCESDLRANAKRSDDELPTRAPTSRSSPRTASSASPCPRSTAASARTTSPSRWSARPSPATAAHRRRCAT